MIDPGLQLVASYSGGRSYGTIMGLLRAAGALSRVVGPFCAGVFYDIEFGHFLNRRRLMPFWVAALVALVGSMFVLGMKKAKGNTKGPADAEIKDVPLAKTPSKPVFTKRKKVAN